MTARRIDGYLRSWESSSAILRGAQSARKYSTDPAPSVGVAVGVAVLEPQHHGQRLGYPLVPNSDRSALIGCEEGVDEGCFRLIAHRFPVRAR